MSRALFVPGLLIALYCSAASGDCPLGSALPSPTDPAGAPRREHDLRFVIDSSAARLRAFHRVGAVFVPAPGNRGELRKTGSGTLIDTCHVLTAYHVVFPEIDLLNSKPRVFRFDPQRVVMFRFGQRTGPGDEGFAQSIEGRPIDLGVFDPYTPSYADELVLVRLNRSAPDALTPLSLDGDVEVIPGAMDFIAAGFPLDGLSRTGVYRLYGDRCAILGPDRISGYATNCSLTDGVSGGALFRVREDSACREPVDLSLAGVANQKDGPDLFPKDHPRRRSYVVPIARNRAVIERALQRDPCDSVQVR